LLDEAWCFVFFGGAVCSGAMVVVLSGAPGAASTTFDGSPAAEADALAGADAVTAAPELPAAVGSAGVVWAAAGAAVFGKTAAVDAADVGAGAFTAAGLSLGGAAAIEAASRDAGFAGAVIFAGAAVVVGAVDAGAAGATDGTASARTLVTIARAATGVFSGSLGRSIRESTTPTPAVAPIAVATKTTRAVRAKPGAGAKYPHSGLKLPPERINTPASQAWPLSNFALCWGPALSSVLLCTKQLGQGPGSTPDSGWLNGPSRNRQDGHTGIPPD
jgi:hypothetical protein